MKKLFTFLSLFCAVVCANAVTYSWDESTHTVTVNFDEAPDVTFNRDNLNNYQGWIRVAFVGNAAVNDISNVQERMDANKTIDLYQTNLSLEQLKNTSFYAGKIVLPKGSGLPESSEYAQGAHYNARNNLLYICSLSEDGTILSVGASKHNGEQRDEIALAITGPDPYFPGSDVNGKSITKIVYYGGDNAREGDEAAVKKFNDAHTPSSFENGILNVSVADYDNINDEIKGTALDLINENKAAITTINLPDGSVWNGTNGSGTLTSNTSDNVAEAKVILQKAGFEVTSQIVNIGHYVKIVDGVVVVTSLSAGALGDNLTSSMTSAEVNAIKGAASLKLVGSFNDADIRGLGGQNNGITTLDLREAEISGTQQLGDLKKYLKTLYMPATDSYTTVSESFCGECTTLEELILSDKIETIGKMAFYGCSNLKSVNFESASNLKTIGYQAFQNTSLTEITIPKSVETIEGFAFYGCNELETVNFTHPSNLTTIGERAFYQTGLKTLNIPATVQRVESQAFGECEKLTKVTFDDLFEDETNEVGMTLTGLMSEKQGVFFNSKNIMDIYVNVDDYSINCENDVFDYDITWGQGQTTAPKATLHYPSSRINDYANLSHVLTYQIASHAGLYHDWLLEHYKLASIPNKNGWFEFINSGESNPDIPEPVYEGSKFLMTYSFYADVTPIEEVGENEANSVARLVPDGVRAYIVNGYDPEKNELKLQRLLVIPPNTGVILYGETNSRDENGNPTLSLTTVGYRGLPLSRETWNYLSDDDKYMKNYLVGTANKDNESIHVTPYEPFKTDGVVTYRNFGMGRFDKTDSGKTYIKEHGLPGSNYVGFFRLKDSNVAPGKAYLRFKADEYVNPDGGEAIILKDNDYYMTYDTSDNPTLSVSEMNEPYLKWSIANWDVDWGKRNEVEGLDNYFVKFVGEPVFNNETDEPTLIFNVADDVDNDNNYYTLQGVRIAKPTQSGIYIKNGKKVFIK